MILDQVIDQHCIVQGAVEQFIDEAVFDRLRPARFALAAKGIGEAFGHGAVLKDGDSETG
ncbi:hypothetical protein D3C85_1879560 [compost metagenome]